MLKSLFSKKKASNEAGETAAASVSKGVKSKMAARGHLYNQISIPVGICLFASFAFVLIASEYGLKAAGVSQVILTKVARNMSLTCIIVVLISTLIVRRLAKKIVSPIITLTDISEKLSRGEDAELPDKVYRNEFEDLLTAFSQMVNSNAALAEAAEKMAAGDFSVEITPRSENDTLGNAMKRLADTNNIVLKKVASAASLMDKGAHEVSGASQSIAQGASSQASAIQEISASITNVEQNVKDNASSASEARVRVEGVQKDIANGSRLLEDMSTAMMDINESSRKISSIIKMIDDIAFQTNILALNAAVEAARAGVHGKGFAVVADEVRNLAVKSAQAASETSELIEDSIKKVQFGDKLANDTLTTLSSIEGNVNECVTLINSIAHESKEQAETIEQISKAVEQVSQVVQNNSVSSEQCATASDTLTEQAADLNRQFRRFKLR